MPYTLDNAEQRAAEAPRTFFIPPPELRHDLREGDLVKLIFCLEPDDGTVQIERMWVEVVATEPYVGTLANHPATKGVIEYGDRVRFGPEHVCAYAYSEDQLGYDPSAACHVSTAVLRDVAPDGLYVGADGTWAAVAGDDGPEQTWTLGDLTDRWPEIEDALREGRELRETWWRREGDRYVRWRA